MRTGLKALVVAALVVAAVCTAPPAAALVLGNAIFESAPAKPLDMSRDAGPAFLRHTGGIAVAIGAMVDAAVILIDNVHKRLERWDEQGRPGERLDVVVRAMQEVGPSIFFSLLVITVSFMPVFTLQAPSSRSAPTPGTRAPRPLRPTRCSSSGRAIRGRKPD